MFNSAPNSSFGYYRGMTQLYGGGAYGGGGSGNTVAGNGVFSQGTGPTGQQGTGWTPTILYMFALIIVEMIIFGILSRKL